MSESISSTVKHSGLTLDSVFVEVQHSEGLGLPKSNHICCAEGQHNQSYHNEELP